MYATNINHGAFYDVDIFLGDKPNIFSWFCIKPEGKNDLIYIVKEVFKKNKCDEQRNQMFL